MHSGHLQAWGDTVHMSPSSVETQFSTCTHDTSLCGVLRYPWFLHVRGDKSNIRIHACCTRHSCFFHVWRDMPTMWMCVVSGPICCSHSQQQQVREETCCEQADSCDCSFQQNKTKRPTTHINATSMYGAAWHQCFLRVLVREDKSTYASLQLHVCGGRAPRSSMCEWQGTCPLHV